MINNSLVYTGTGMTLSNTGHHNNKCGRSFVRAYHGDTEILGRHKHTVTNSPVNMIFKLKCLSFIMIFTNIDLVSS